MYLGLIYTFLTGLFFLIGIIISKHNKNNEAFSLFITSLAFVVMLSLLLCDLLPELYEVHNIYYLIPIILGFLILVFLDKLIPHHHHEHHEEKNKEDVIDHNLHLNHIGIITIIALGIHNLLEGLTLYNLTLSSYLSGLLFMISISLHNIPLGFQIGNALVFNKKNILLILFLVLSSLFGAVIIIIFGNLSSVIINILLALTIGMILYILIFELFNEIKSSFKKKEVIYGIIVGVIILIVTFLVGE